MSELKRTAFSTSRAAEYFDARELSAQTGRPPAGFAAVVLKELVDNALDACETAKVAPEIGIEVGQDDGLLRLAVADNGPGLPPEVVRKVLDYSVRISDKAAYRSPTRGAQGNALKTVVGIPHALGSREPVVVEARGVRHVIHPHIDPAGELRIGHDEEPAGGAGGTRVSVALPNEGQYLDPEWWARAFALFNPHANVRISRSAPGGEHAKSSPRVAANFYKSTAGEDFKKYRPTDPTSPHWYSDTALKRLVFAHVGDARGGGRDLPLGEFVRQFRGLTSTRKAKTVCSALGEIGHLSGFEERPEAIADLLAAMTSESKPPSHAVLGEVGEDHLRTVLEEAYEVRELTYRRVRGHFPSGLPYTFEFALAVTEEPGDLYTGINFSPTFDDPLEGVRLFGPKVEARGIRGLLHEAHAEPGGWDPYAAAHTAAVAHIVTPAPVYMDRGKTRIQLEEG
ncbi:MAG: hypothetical protein H0V53_08990 [Rubrobacter sp.]|nr:hypothetical protein [Rubrobacter sp.]